MKCLLSFIAVLTLGLSTTQAAEKTVSEMKPEVQKLLLVELADALPGYIDAVEAVLKEIDALPAGTVTESTRLSQIPIVDLFAKHESKLRQSKLISDTDFAGGRNEENVAWLRQSLVDLKALTALVKQSKDRAAAGLDNYITVVVYGYRASNDFHFIAIVNPISRFYCNMNLAAKMKPGMKTAALSVSETCD